MIIPTLNGGPYLEKLFKALREQSIHPTQILVIDSSSQDDTVKICRSFKVDFIQIESNLFDHGGTRNLAASNTTGDILVFMTQDSFFRDSQCLENLIRSLESPKIAASYGRQMPRKDANPVERFARTFNYPLQGMIKSMDDLPQLGVRTFFFSNAFSAIKKEAFMEVGGFPEKTIMNEDMFLAAKLLQKGYKIAYQPEAVVFHSHHYSLTTQFKRYFDIGVFFNRNRWIKELGRSEKEGIKYLWGLFRFLVDNEQWKWIPYALVETTYRFFGYRIGLVERILPLWLKKRISYNKHFWKTKAPHFVCQGNLRC